MKLRIPQPVLSDAIQGRGRHYAAERTRRAETAIVGHNEKDVRRVLGRDDAGRPPRFRVGGFLLDPAAERRIRRWQLFAVNGRRGAWRAKVARDLLGPKRSRRGDKNASQDTAEENLSS